MRLHASSSPQSRRRSTERLGMLLDSRGLAEIVGHNHFAEPLAAAWNEREAHFVRAENTQMVIEGLGILHFVSQAEQVNEGQAALRENAQRLSGFTLA